MQRFIVSLAASVCLVALLGAAPAHAAFATFASGSGNDASDCLTPATACRQISGATGALSKTTAGGVIAVLAGDYDAFTIGEAGKQVDIIGQGGLAMVASQLLAVPGGGEAAIIVNVDASGNMPIKIHGLTIAAGGGGIVILGNSPEVDIRNCTIVGAGPNYAVDFRPSQTGELYITNTVISRAVGSGTGGGIRIQPTSGATANVVLDHAGVENHVTGILVNGGAGGGAINMNIRDSVISGASAQGLSVFEATSGAPTTVVLDRTTISSNGGGIFASRALASVRVRQSVISGNGVGLQSANGGQIISHGDNVLAGNTTNGAFTATVAPQ